MLVAPSITDSAMKLLKEYGLEFKELHPPRKPSNTEPSKTVKS
jgi:Predicted nuclease of the RecB family